jgi:hypothetical protein
LADFFHDCCTPPLSVHNKQHVLRIFFFLQTGLAMEKMPPPLPLSKIRKKSIKISYQKLATIIDVYYRYQEKPTRVASRY